MISPPEQALAAVTYAADDAFRFDMTGQQSPVDAQL
jgi:hypothetical protein